MYSLAMMTTRLRLEGSVLSDTGNVRQNNEDSYFFDTELGLFAVADGMGGHAGGEVASRMAVEALERAARRGIPDAAYLADQSLAGRQQILDWLTVTIDAMNLELQAKVEQDPRLTGMGCTLDVVLFRRSGVFTAHVGDSRSYLLRQGRLFQLTQDHTLGQMMVLAGVITPEEAEKHPQRHVLTRALGPFPRVDIDTSYFETAPGDCYLLCSDGLYGDLSEEYLQTQLMSQPPQQAMQTLMQAALAAGGRDNITGMVVSVTDCRSTQPVIIGSNAALVAMARSPIFSTFTWHEMVSIQKIAIGRVLAAGEDLITQGGTCDFVGLNVDGEHLILADGNPVGVGFPGDPFGELSLSPEPAKLTVRAQTPLTVLEFPLDRVRDLIASEPELGVKVAMAALAHVTNRVRILGGTLARYHQVYGPPPEA